MQSNVLVAVKNIIENPILNINQSYKSHNKINNNGEALETYIKDVFCGSVDLEVDQKLKKYNTLL